MAEVEVLEAEVQRRREVAKVEMLDYGLVRQELELVRELSRDGLLRPGNVVAWARQHVNSVIHGQLEWDDTKAGEAYRIDQARQLIRVIVTYSTEVRGTVRAYISQPSDRVRGGGYRTYENSILQARQELVADALNELRNLSNRWTHLPELGPIFAVLEKAVREFRDNKLAAG